MDGAARPAVHGQACGTARGRISGGDREARALAVTADLVGSPRCLFALLADIGDGELRQLESLVRAELRRRKQAQAERSGTADLESQLRESVAVVQAGAPW